MTITPAFVKIRLLAFLALIFVGIQTFAAPSISIKPTPSWVIPIVPAGKAAPSKNFSGGFYLSLSDIQVNLDQKTTYEHFIRQIVSESGIQNGSEFSVTFDPLYERIDVHNITVWRDGKSIPQMNVADFKILPLETDRQRFIYNGYYSASLVLKDIRKGDRIEIAYSRIGWNPVFQNKYSGTLSFYTYDYISHIHYAVIAKKGRDVLFKEFNKPPAKTVKPTVDGNIYEWELHNVKNIPYDDQVPIWYNNQPFVQISEYKSWKEVVDWGRNFYQVPAISGALKSKADEWKKSSNSNFAFIEKAVRFVQDEIRYLGIETGENSHRPHNPEDVFRQRYGDCKDKAFLLCAILKANGIECDPVLVDTYKRYHLSEYLPSPTDFNHVVVRIRTIDKGPDLNDAKAFIFVDATISLQGGTLSKMSFPPYGQGLLLKSGQIKPLSIPIQNPGYLTIEEDIYLPELGDTSLNGMLQVKTVYFEGEADSFRNFFQESVISETEESYLNYYRDSYKHAQFEVSDTLEFYDQREANNFSLVERYSMKNAWQYDSTRRKYYFNILGKALYDQLVILPNRNRRDPVFLRYPYHNTYTIRIHMPGPWNVANESWKIEREAYLINFKSQLIASENVWELTYDYQTLQDHVSLAQSGQFKKDIEKLSTNLEYQLNTPDTTNGVSTDDMNWFTLLFSILTIAGSAYFFSRLRRYSPLAGPYHQSAIEIGGWLILIGISIVVQPLTMLYSMLSESGAVYYSKAGWEALSEQSDLKMIGYKSLLVFEIFFNLVLISFTVLLSYLFFKKRDSFPLLFSYFLAGKLVFLVIDTAAAYALNGSNGLNTYSEAMMDVFRQTVAAAIWIPYMNKSTRVKQTFVNTYDENLISEPSTDSEALNNADIEN